MWTFGANTKHNKNTMLGINASKQDIAFIHDATRNLCKSQANRPLHIQDILFEWNSEESRGMCDGYALFKNSPLK